MIIYVVLITIVLVFITIDISIFNIRICVQFFVIALIKFGIIAIDVIVANVVIVIVDYIVPLDAGRTVSTFRLLLMQRVGAVPPGNGPSCSET